MRPNAIPLPGRNETSSNVVLTPHLGYVVDDVFSYYYRDIVEDIEAWIGGNAIRILNPDAQR